MIYPWMIQSWVQLASRVDRLPHGWLFTGPEGIGKRALATSFANGLLCRSRALDYRPCGRCPACHWFTAGTHPDFRLIQPEAAQTPDAIDPEAETAASTRKPSKLIRIDQARALQDWLAIGAHQGGWRIAVVSPAEAMNAATANALLKTLEEPPPRTVLILISAEPARLLPTIRSRCQAIAFPLPAHQDALDWLSAEGMTDAAEALALAGGAPLVAIERPERVALARMLAADLSAADQDAVGLSARYQGALLPDVIDLLQKWTYDVAATMTGLPVRYYPNAAQALERAARGVDSDRALAFHGRLAQARRLADHPLAPRLVLEELFIEYAHMRSHANPSTAGRARPAGNPPRAHV